MLASVIVLNYYLHGLMDHLYPTSIVILFADDVSFSTRLIRAFIANIQCYAIFRCLQFLHYI